MTALRVIAAGPGVTLQDGGRQGWLRWGVTSAGPMDRDSFEIVNRALGRPATQTAIEVSIGGLEVEAEGRTLGVAVVGGGFRVSVDGEAQPSAVRLALGPGQRLKIALGRAGCWAYLAVNGWIGVAPVLGSTATHVRSGVGGLEGRGLEAGDRLQIADAAPAADRGALQIDAPNPDDPIRVIVGPQTDAFSAEEIDRFFAATWRLSPRSDRMAYRLEGDAFVAAPRDIVSDATAFGSIQIPGDGVPLVLMADRQPTGGYPKIATVIGADLDRLAQRRPGAALRFQAVTVEEAVAALRARAKRMAAPVGIETGDPLTPEFLLGQNLISGVETDLQA